MAAPDFASIDRTREAEYRFGMRPGPVALIVIALLAVIGTAMLVFRDPAGSAGTAASRAAHSSETPNTESTLNQDGSERPSTGESHTGSSRSESRSNSTNDRELPVEDFGGDFFTDFDESETPTRALVRHAVVTTIADHFPDYRLSSDEVERVTESLVTLRETQEALRALPFDEEHAAQRRILVERIGDASAEFGSVLGIDPAEFTARAASEDSRIDGFDPHDAIPDAEFIQDHRPAKGELP